MLDAVRNNLTYVFPVLILIMVIGLVLSRVYQPEPAFPEPEIHISAAEAINHVGTPAKVCGEVVSADFITEIEGKPTFLNFGKPYPNQVFTAVIWDENRSKWDTPPHRNFEKRQVCVVGTIEMHEGTPQIIIAVPEQVQLQKK